jgi:hypothetical protein
MTPHDHSVFVPGCYRCELGQDELLAGLLEEQEDRPSGPQWWWLSFADPDLPAGEQWLGGCFAPGADIVQAAVVAHAASCNPGGEVLGAPIDADLMARVPRADRLRLIVDVAYVDALGSTDTDDAA